MKIFEICGCLLLSVSFILGMLIRLLAVSAVVLCSSNEVLNMLQVGKTAFRGTKKLNLIQSVVFDAAYNSNENLLICAPTGAGKTNIAMLTVLRELKQHIVDDMIKTDEFKVLLHCNVISE